MSTLHIVPDDIRESYHVKEWRNATGVLATACPTEWQDVQDVLRGFRLLKSEVLVGGGNRSLISRRIDGAFYAKGWQEKGFATSITVDETTFNSPTHAVDCLKGGVAVEMEWNNKDPFFDRDLENFKRLHSEGAISIGGIITRGTSLQNEIRTMLRRFADRIDLSDLAQLDGFGYNPTRRQRRMIEERADRLGDFRQAWVEVFASDKYGEATTHWRKLQDRVLRGVGNPCPLVLIGIPGSVVSFDGNYSAAEL